MRKGEVGHIAYILVLVGGILMVLFSLLGGMLGFLGFLRMTSFGMPRFGGFDILGLILGVVAIVLAKRVTELLWGIVLIIIGIIGGSILVVIGAILGLIAKYI